MPLAARAAQAFRLKLLPLTPCGSAHPEGVGFECPFMVPKLCDGSRTRVRLVFARKAARKDKAPEGVR